MGSIRVGTSGWRYPRWRGDFYPAGLPQRAELEYAAQRMTSLEVNGSFYSLQRPSSYAAWRAAVPADFLFAVKGGRFITHLKQLREVEVPLANFFASGVLALGPTLGPVLWQLPARMPFDPARLGAFLDLLPRSTAAAARLAEGHDEKLPEGRALTVAEVDLPLRHALEGRHPSFGERHAVELLRQRDVSLVVSDGAGEWPLIEELTSGLVYVRLHGDTELYASGYSPAALDDWARKCARWGEAGHDVVVYFDNDARGHAPHDAVALLDRLTRPGSAS